MIDKREVLLKELKNIYDENKISGFGLKRIDLYTRKNSSISIVKAFIEPFEIGDSIYPVVPLLLMDNNDYVPLVDENQLMKDSNYTDVYKRIVEIVNKLI